MTAPLTRDEAVRLGRIDPAASAYGDHLRRKGVLPAVPPATPVLVTTPADEVAMSAIDVRRAVLARFCL